ncbi:MAG: DUF99 family protein [Methanocalculus sp. MSAO_Arc1]|uniref:endonuclease dU n=1 Tax=Methanocalculus TaxID=71151 RepID=UPI000FEF0212|nr:MULTISPECIES: DUF99 family protein [unclassified Methanocalculus]MCP1662820.1 endonuclease V-like protein UPF0215 family [Methanocalculus sp. AMF5]RQD79014.1 MAG: DUF99 family protein [Methanocalculus sp. MSAO_Arc1]
MHLEKPGIRILGIAESWTGRERSVLAGIVMRGDRRIDGCALSTVTVGGMDATDAVIRLVSSLSRSDINLIVISGAAIAWYNIIDPDTIHAATGIPVILLTYEESGGLEDAIQRLFPGDEKRMQAYLALGERDCVPLQTGYSVFLRRSGIPLETARRALCRFTLDGRIPEPVRVARLVARSVMQSSQTGK